MKKLKKIKCQWFICSLSVLTEDKPNLVKVLLPLVLIRFWDVAQQQSGAAGATPVWWRGG
jgi:hypothetical protein